MIKAINSKYTFILILLFAFVFETQAQTLDATFSSPDVNQCPDNLFTINATNTTYGNSNYSWLITGPNGYSQTNTGSSVAFYLTVSGFYDVQLTVTDGVITESNTQNSFIQVYNNPIINYSVTQTTGCTPLVVTFNSNCSPGSGTLASFTANVGGTSYTTEDFTHTFTSGGSFTPSVTVTNSFGCFTIGNLSTVTVTNSPSLTSSLNPNSICSGSTFNYTPTSNISGTTYSWVRTLAPGITGSGSNTSTGTSGLISQTLNNATSGDLQATYTITSTANGCSTTQNVVVIVRALPTVSIIQGSILTICSGQTGTLTAAGVPSGGTYLWSTGATTASINVTTAGIRSVTYSDGTCSSTAVTSTVSITSPPTISGFTITETSGTVNDGSICPNATAAISATVSAPGGNFLWSNGATTSSISVIPPITTTYTLTYTLGCATNSSTEITVLSLPTPSFTPLVSNFCSPPATVTFTNTSTNASGGVTWSFQGGTPTTSIANQPIITYNSSGSYSVTLTATSAAGCTRTTFFPNAITVDSGTPPTSLFNPTTPLTQCYSSIAAPANAVADNSVCFQYVGTGADTLQLNWGDGSSLELIDEVSAFCHTYGSSGTYTVTATPYSIVENQLGCAGTPVSFTVVIQGPVASFALSAIDCENQQTRTFTNTTIGASGSAAFAWNFGDPASGVNNSSTLPIVSHTFTQYQSSGYPVNLTVTDASSGCPASSITTNVFAYPNNTATFQSYNNPTPTRVVTTEVCLNGSLTFYNETPLPQLATQDAHTVWNINNTNPTWSAANAVRGNPNTYNFLETGNSTNFNVDWVPGIYTVSMRNRRDNPDPNNSCFEIETRTNYITVHGIIGTFTAADTVCANATMSVTDNSSAPVTSIVSRLWNWGDGTPNTTGNISNPSHTYTNTGTFTISLTATDAFGCTKTTTKQVVVRNPLASFSVDRNYICPAQTVTVTNNSTGLGLTSFVWSVPTATPSSATGTNPTPFTFNVAGSRSINLTVTDDFGCVKDTTVAITVQNPVPSAIASQSVASCFNPITNVTFTNTSTNNVDSTSAIWNFNSTGINNGSGVSPFVSNTWQPSAAFHLPGTYIVTLQVSSLTSCASTVQQVATVTIGGPSGTINVTNSNLTGCSCYTANMTVSSSNATEAKLLYGDGQFLVLTPNTTQNVSYSYCNSSATTITRTPSLFISNGACEGFIQANQTINIDPIPTINPIPDQIVCAGELTTPITFSGSAQQYNWINDNTSIGLAPSGTGNVAGFVANNPTATNQIATITVTPVNGSCNSTPTTFTITVKPMPTVDTPQNQTRCHNDSTFAISFSGAINGTDYNWTNSNSSIGYVNSGTGNIPSFQVQNTTFGSQIANFVVTPSLNGCLGSAINFNITVLPLPIVNAGNDTTLCFGESFTPIVTGNASTFIWNNGLVYNTPFTPTLTNTYTVIGSNNTCYNSDSITVTINSVPQLTISTFDGEDSLACDGTLSVLVTDGTAPYSYTWTNGATNYTTAAIQNLCSGTYSLAVVDANGCSATNSAVINDTLIPIIVGDTLIFTDNIYQDSTIIGADTSDWIENCTFDYDLVTGATISSYVDNGSSTIVTWLISLSDGSTIPIEATYNLSPGTAGVYDLTLQLTCSQKSDPKFLVANSRLYYEGSTIGIQTNSLSSFQLYPNPAKSTLSISGINETFQFDIRDIQGKLLKQGANDKQIEIEHLPAGTYVISISTDNEVKQLRFVKL